MKSILAAGFIGFAVFIFLGGQIPHFKLIRKKKFQISLRQNKQADQEFLGYLWNLKSDLSAGAIPANLQINPPSHEFARRLGLVLRISEQTGTSVTPLLNRFIKQVKYQIELKQEIASELASTKATVLVLALLPLFGVLLTSFLGANSVIWLMQNSFGRIALGFALILNLLGWVWVKRIIKNSLKA